jgi:hypothetical protein
MNRVWKKGLCAGTFLSLAALTALPVRTSEGLETVPGVESLSPAPPPEAAVEPSFRSKPLKKTGLVFTRALARASQPFLNYSRNHLVRLLPSKKHLPDHLSDKDHWDYPGPLQWVPRGWTTYDWGQPAMLVGNQVKAKDGSPLPIGERGSYQLSVYPELPVPFCWVPIYFAFTLPNGLHFRMGARWDDVDAYVNLPSVAIKKRVK